MDLAGMAPLTVLVADRHRAVADSLSRVISQLGAAEVTGQAHSLAEALELGGKLAPDIALIDLDLSPNCELVSGLHLIAPHTRIIVMGDKDRGQRDLLVKALESGAVGALYKHASLDELEKAVTMSSRDTPVITEEATGLLLGSYLEAMVEKHERDMSTIEALAAALEVRDLDTGKHVRRVTDLAKACLGEIDPGLSHNEELAFGFMLHDVGKIGVPDAILHKPGPLSTEEWALMHQHPHMGVRIVQPLGFTPSTTDVILHHHERWDGTGYPHRLGGEEIPVAARAFAVVDAFDAMTSDRPYRRAMSTEDAHRELRAGNGSMYDPDMVDVIIDLTDSVLSPG